MRPNFIFVALLAVLVTASPAPDSQTDSKTHTSAVKQSHSATGQAPHTTSAHSQLSPSHATSVQSLNSGSQPGGTQSQEGPSSQVTSVPSQASQASGSLSASSSASVSAIASSSDALAAKPTYAVSSEYLDACDQAPNCEVYTTSQGQKAIRFKAGQGPGSDAHNRLLVRAANSTSTYTTKVSLGGQSVGFGCKVEDGGPVLQPSAFLKKLGSICQSTGTCVTTKTTSQKISNYVKPNQKGSSGKAGDATLQLTAEGQFPTADRDNFIAAIAAYADKGTKQYKQTQEYVPLSKRSVFGRIAVPPTEPIKTSCENTIASNFYNIARYEGSGQDANLAGYMTAQVAVETDAENLFCDYLAPILGGLGGAIPEVGAAVGAVFGVVSAACAAAS